MAAKAGQPAAADDDLRAIRRHAQIATLLGSVLKSGGRIYNTGVWWTPPVDP